MTIVISNTELRERDVTLRIQCIEDSPYFFRYWRVLYKFGSQNHFSIYKEGLRNKPTNAMIAGYFSNLQ